MYDCFFNADPNEARCGVTFPTAWFTRTGSISSSTQCSRYRKESYIRFKDQEFPYAHQIICTMLQLLVGLLLEVIHKWKRVAPIYILGVKQ